MGNGENNSTSVPEITGQKKKNPLLAFFTSIKLAVVLILVIGGFSLLGALVPWMDVFHSWWFLAAGSLLMINIVICTLNRWKSIKIKISGSSIIRDESFYDTGNNSLKISTNDTDIEGASQKIRNIFKSRGYRVREERKKGNIYVAADTNRYFRLGTLVSHFSIVLFVLAYLLGSYLGFKEAGLVVPEGATVEIGHDTGLSLELVSFQDTYYPDGTPKDYRSQVVLYKNGQKVLSSVVRVNEPLSYNDIRVYQSFFGPAVHMRIATGGQVVFDGNVALDRIFTLSGQSRPIGNLMLPQFSSGLFLIGSSAGSEDTIIPRGQIALLVNSSQQPDDIKLLKKGVPYSLGNTEYTYVDDSMFSGFQVNRDPANALIWIAAALFIAGIVMVFYFPYRRAWALVQPSQTGLLICLRSEAGRMPAGNEELQKLVSEIEVKTQN